MTAEPITVVPLRIVKVSVPSLTVPAALVTVALRGTVWPAGLNVAEVLAAAVDVAAGLMVTVTAGVDLADHVVGRVGDEQVARGIDGDAGGKSSSAAVAGPPSPL